MKNISITTDHTLNFYDLDRLAKSVVKPGMSNEEKALACYDVVREYMFHYPWVYNVKERQEEWHDATKLLNTYGHGLCGVQARTLGALYQKVFGYDNQRLIGLNECASGDWALDKDPGAFLFSTMQKAYSPENVSGHTCVEVFYDGHWHHLDPMVEFYCYTRDGSRIASLEDTLADPTLVTQPSCKIDGLMPDGDLGKVFYQSRFADWTPGPGYFMVMDTQMDVSLEEGQSVTWYWEREHERFFWPEIWAERFTQPYFDDGPRHPDKRQGTWRHYGNGTFETKKKNITQGETISLSCPYVLVGGVLRFDAEAYARQVLLVCTKEDQCEWLVDIAPGISEIRLEEWVTGGYDFSFCLRDGDLQNVTVELFFQHNFMALPHLVAGENVVSVAGESEDETLNVLWAWEEGGVLLQHAESVTPLDDYIINVGAVASGKNPKYMKKLQIAV